MRQCRLTTFDNPYDPFEQFDQWFMFDIEKKHNTCGVLARIIKESDDFTQKESEEANEAAIDEIIKYDFTNTYKKVVRNDRAPVSA